MNEVPAGWYPDPSGVPDQLRWWDGGQWTDDFANASAFAGPQPTVESEPAPTWEQSAQAPEIDWEPHAEPPPWDDEHGPPVADWEAEPLPSPWDQEPVPEEPATVEFGGPPAAAPQQQPPWDQQYAQVPSPEPSGYTYEQVTDQPRQRRPWLLFGGIAAGLAVVLLLAVGGGYAWVNRGGPTAEPSTSGSAPSKSPSAARPTGPKVTAGDVSYVRLDGAWGEPTGTGIKELTPNKGQAQVTQRNAPGVRGDWVAQVTVGELAKRFTYSGPDDLEKTTGAFAKSVADSYYDPLKTTREDTGKKSLKVSGRDAYQMTFHLAFQNPPDGFAAKGETVHVVVVDDDPRPVGVYITIPDNKPELRPTADEVIRGLQVA